ncbi:MAG: DUF2807 domain-containing protein [Bacteroidales bacterium]|nr:DUF2807 domain-containing protein [Bacteroidales bacterium]
MLFFLFLFPLWGLGGSCNNPDACLRGAGKTQGQTIEISEFSALNIHGIFKIELVPDTCNKITMRAGKNLLNSVKIEQDGNAVHLYNSSRCAMFKGYEKITMRIHFSHIDSLCVWEACEVVCTQAIQNNLFINMQATMCDIRLHLDNSITKLITLNKAGGLIELYGTSANADFTVNYTAELNARNLQTENTAIVSSTVFDCLVYATKTVTATANRNGKILYAGNPERVMVKNGTVEPLP